MLVHGAWHGGWCWGKVAAILRGRGHTVLTPTQTGLGERSHLLSKSITLDTFVDDIVNVLKFEELKDVILVGHSFGGNAISGTADRMPDRIRQLVYLDAAMLENGQSVFSLLPPDVVAARTKAAQDSSGGLSIPPPPAAAFGLSDPAQQAWLTARLTPHPFGTFTSPLNLKNKIANGLPAIYIILHRSGLRTAAGEPRRGEEDRHEDGRDQNRPRRHGDAAGEAHRHAGRGQRVTRRPRPDQQSRAFSGRRRCEGHRLSLGPTLGARPSARDARRQRVAALLAL